MRKKILGLVLVIYIMLALVPHVSAATGTKYGDIYYTIDGDTITITGFVGTGATIEEIPSTINDLPVTKIADSAFYHSNVTNITLPNTITSIGYSAFSSCNQLTHITLSEAITSIEDFAFLDCQNLTEISIPSRLTSINTCVFKGCGSLKNVSIPDSVINIGSGAFDSCKNLTNILIPYSITNISPAAFSNCGSLEISVDSKNSNYSSIDGILFNKSADTLIEYAKDKIQPEYTIPSSVITIGYRAFAYCNKLTEILIPDSVTSIENDAFINCINLNAISMSNNITNIGVSAFERCSNLKSALISDKVTIIDEHTFYGCKSLTNISIPENTTEIRYCAFSFCDDLTAITIPDNVTTIGNGAFLDCNSLTDVYYGGSEREWNNIAIDSGNDSLIYATIHFTTKPCFSISQESSKTEITNLSEDEQTAIVIVAEYESDILKDVTGLNTTFAAGEKKTYDFSENKQYKVFVWDGLKGMRPLNK